MFCPSFIDELIQEEVTINDKREYEYEHSRDGSVLWAVDFHDIAAVPSVRLAPAITTRAVSARCPSLSVVAVWLHIALRAPSIFAGRRRLLPWRAASPPCWLPRHAHPFLMPRCRRQSDPGSLGHAGPRNFSS